jgi:hypothetical protein
MASFMVEGVAMVTSDQFDQLPKRIYVTHEESGGEKYLVVFEDREAFLENAEDGQLVGVYELKEARRATVKRNLEPL